MAIRAITKSNAKSYYDANTEHKATFYGTCTVTFGKCKVRCSGTYKPIYRQTGDDYELNYIYCDSENWWSAPSKWSKVS